MRDLASAEKVQAILSNLTSLDKAHELFSHLNYEYASAPIHNPLTDAPFVEDIRIIAEQSGFKIVFVHFNTDSLKIGDERRLITPLLSNYRFSLFVVCNKNMDYWHFVNVKDSPDTQSRRVFRRITVEPKRIFMRTAVERITMLDAVGNKGEILNLTDIQGQHEKAFDVEAVTKKFYIEFRNVFYATKEKIQDIAVEEKHYFTQSLFNRLLFLKFLEKKGWLDYNFNYLNELLRQAITNNKNYYRNYLYPLFFFALNNQFEDSEIGNKEYVKNQIGTIPYLNGGLFEFAKNYKDWDANIDNKVFKDIFQFFNLYNFTISENTPLELEVAVDPEMLGKVFENLINSPEEEDTGSNKRKETGSYYTPRSIVNYMCKQSLIHFIINSSSDTSQKQIENLVYDGDLTGMTYRQAQSIMTNLKKIQVLDPACGSGAFLVEMLHILVEAQNILMNKALSTPKSLYELKLDIIQNNLYGTDIQEFATNIAKLRFWLSLAVDFNLEFKDKAEFQQNVGKIAPLPNLAFKIRTGDALVEAVGDIVFNKQGDIFIDHQLTDEINSKKTIYENPLKIKASGISKENLEKEIYALESSLINRLMLKKDSGPVKTNSIIWRVHFAEIFENKSSSTLRRGKFSFINEIPGQQEMVESSKPAFGFDIVIANPPYIRQEKIRNYKPLFQKAEYLIYNSTSDIYTYFYEKAIDLLKDNGILCFISSNKWMRAKYGEKLRKYLKDQTALIRIIDFGGCKVFDATVDTCIVLLAKNSKKNNNVELINITEDMSDIDRINEYSLDKKFAFSQNRLGDDCWTIADNKTLKLKEKIEKIGTPLKDWNIEIKFGIKTGFNDSFIINTAIKEKLCKEDPKSIEVLKPILRGRDIGKYYYKWAGLWLIKIESRWTNKHRGTTEPEKFFRNTYPAIYNHLKITGESKGKGKGLYNRDDKGDYWWELRDCAYYPEFEKRKIIYPNIEYQLSSVIDSGIYFTNQKCYIIVGKAIEYLCSLFNSKLIDWYFKMIGATLGGAGYEMSKIFIEQLPIKEISPEAQRHFIDLVDRILAITKEEDYLRNPGKQARVKEYEREIDKLVYELYGLTEEEIAIVEGKGKLNA